MILVMQPILEITCMWQAYRQELLPVSLKSFLAKKERYCFMQNAVFFFFKINLFIIYDSRIYNLLMALFFNYINLRWCGCFKKSWPIYGVAHTRQIFVEYGKKPLHSSCTNAWSFTSNFWFQVLECHLVTDPRTRESRGFGFVTMETTEDAERCIKYLNRSVLEGRLVTVEKVLSSGVRICSYWVAWE